MTNMKDMILLGPPGSGKGTQAENISGWYGIPQISTGEIFRSNIKAGTKLGAEAKAYIDAGGLVPDDVTIAIVSDRLGEADCINGFILDGFPRTVPQAQALADLLSERGRGVRVVAGIYVPDATIVKRLTGRRACLGCGRTYHVDYNPPASEGVCDRCGGEIAQRADDREETVKQRLEVYHSQTSPLIDYYRNLGLYVEITGRELVEETTEEMRSALKIVFGV